MRPELDVQPVSPTLSVTAACAIAAIALAVAMGIGRFAFTPLLPLMVRDGSLAPSAGAWLAASNYLGYLAGALTASRLGLSAAGADAREPCRHRRRPPPPWARSTDWRSGYACASSRACSAPGRSSRPARGRCSIWRRRDARISPAWSTRASALALPAPGCSASWPRDPACRPASCGWSSGRWQRFAVVLPSAFCRAGRCGLPPAPRPQPPADRATARPHAGLVICYGVLGFGYILPATFLPALAREVVDDPQMFGLAWPVFGIAAALSTIVIGGRLGACQSACASGRSAISLMATGVVLPSLWLAPVTIAIAALPSAAPSWW